MHSSFERRIISLCWFSSPFLILNSHTVLSSADKWCFLLQRMFISNSESVFDVSFCVHYVRLFIIIFLLHLLSK